MSNAVSIAIAWGAVFGVFGLYLWSVLKRTKAAEKLVPAGRSRWMTTDAAGPDESGQSNASNESNE